MVSVDDDDAWDEPLERYEARTERGMRAGRLVYSEGVAFALVVGGLIAAALLLLRSLDNWTPREATPARPSPLRHLLEDR